MTMYDTAANYSLRDDTGASHILFITILLRRSYIDGTALLDDHGDNNSFF